jgi:hypothetical protein
LEETFRIQFDTPYQAICDSPARKRGKSAAALA